MASKMNQFIMFLTVYNFAPKQHKDLYIPPLSPEFMACYATELCYKASINKLSTINSYISTVNSWCKANNRPNPTHALGTTEVSPLYKGVITGIAKSIGESPTQRMPITRYHLDRLWISAQSLPTEVKTNYCAMITLAWYALLRVGEFTIKSLESFNPAKNMTRRAIKFFPNQENPTHYSVFLKCSKTDQTGVGHLQKIFTTHDAQCPVKAMQRLFQLYPLSLDQPIFQLDNSPTRNSRTKFHSLTVSLLKEWGIDTSMLKSHSFRQGGASAALQFAPAWQVKLLGRWKSDAWERYAFMDDFLVQRINLAMSNAPRIAGSTTGRYIYDGYQDDITSSSNRNTSY
jgi:hypothetical protein